MDAPEDLSGFIKITDPDLALDDNLRPTRSDPDALKAGILKLRHQVSHLARDLKRSIVSEGQLHEYLQDLLAFQEMVRQLGPLRDTEEVMGLMLRITREVVRAKGCLLYLWGRTPLQKKMESVFNLSQTLAQHIENELTSGRVLDGHETNPMAIPFLPVGIKDEGSLILVPLVSGERQLGVIAAHVERSHLHFFQYHLNLFSMLGSAAVIALENAHLYQKIQHLSVRDDLTELFNSRYLRSYIGQIIEELSHHKNLALFFMDLDNFKKVNDHHGHLVGSTVLVEAAKLIQDHAAGGCASRYGGDEFVLANPGLDEPQALAKAETMRRDFETLPFNRQGEQNIHLTISIGVALCPQQTDSVDDLIHYADLAMYASKTAGRNRVTLWTPELG